MTVYLDWNATTPLRPEARAAWLAAQDEDWGNPGSIHAAGQRARHRLDQAKAELARRLGCAAHELIVTSGGTEANAQAIASALAGGGDAAISAIEHSSVRRNAQRAVERGGGALREIAVDRDGRLDPTALRAGVGDSTRLVAFQFANNEIGTLQDVPALVAAVRAANPKTSILLDGCQGAGKQAIDLRALGVDYASVAGHKFGAPKGVGLLYARAGAPVEAVLNGGRQQQDRRSGTEDSAMVSALAAAFAAATGELAGEDARQRALLERLWTRLSAHAPRAVWVARAARRLPNTLSLGHPGCAREHLVARLDLAGFAVSPGAACSAARGAPSQVIGALGLDPDLARSVVRVSIGRTTTADEVDAFAVAYAREAAALASV